MPGRTVNPRYLPFTLAVPINTPASAPLVTTIATPSTVLDRVHLVIPNGHVGLTGFHVKIAQQIVLPYASGTTWIVSDGIERDFDMGMLQVDAVTLEAFNTDTVYTHTFYGQIVVRDNVRTASAAAPVNVIPITSARAAS